MQKWVYGIASFDTFLGRILIAFWLRGKKKKRMKILTSCVCCSHDNLSEDYLQQIISWEGEWLTRGLRGRRGMHRVLYAGAFKATLLRQEKMAKERLENVQVTSLVWFTLEGVLAWQTIQMLTVSLISHTYAFVLLHSTLFRWRLRSLYTGLQAEDLSKSPNF